VIFLKICITSTGNNTESLVEKNFGRAPYLAVYDTVSEEFTFLENKNMNLSGGVGPKTAQMVIDSQAEVLITGMIGDNAKNVIDAAKIRIIKTGTDKSVKVAASEFESENSA